MPLELSDEELVKRCKIELPDVTRSYEVLVQRYTDRVYSLAYRLLGNRQEAEDVSQEIFIKVYHNLKKFEEQSAFSSWLYRIATNTALNMLDKLKRSPQPAMYWPETSNNSSSSISSSNNEVSNDRVSTALEQGTKLNTPDNFGSMLNLDPLESIIRSELHKCIEDVFAQLDRTQASVLIMRDMDNLSYEEVAQSVGIGLSAIKMRIHRARLAFQELFNRLCSPISNSSTALDGVRGVTSINDVKDLKKSKKSSTKATSKSNSGETS